MLRILHSISSIDDQCSGVAACVRRLAGEMGHLVEGVQVVSVGSRQCRKNDRYIDQRVPQQWSNVPVLWAMSISRKMRKELHAQVNRIDIVHNHGLWLMPNVYVGKIAGKKKQVPLVMSPHGMLSPGALRFSRLKKDIFWAIFQGKVAHNASCFHATCEEEYEDIRAYGVKAPVAIVPNGIDLPEMPVLKKSERRRRVISLGRIHPKKALDRLVSAWSCLEQDFPEWELLLVGPDEGGYAHKLAEQIRKLNLKRASIRGAVFGAEKNRILGQSDIFVLSTLSDNFALTVAESLAAGTPVISTKGAPWQGLEDNQCGWWIDHGIEPLANALRTAMSLTDEERASMGQRGRAWMARDFSWDNIAQQMIEVYQWLIIGGEPPVCVRID